MKETEAVSNVQNNTRHNTQLLKQLLPPKVQEQTRYSLRNPNNFIVPVMRTTFYFNSYLPSSLREWNSLNTASRNSSSLVSFKCTLNKLIIVPPYFYTIQTSRIGQILHTCIRLECSSLNQHLYKKNLINSPNCSCSQVESAAHVLFSCPRYNQIRQRYFQNIPLPLTVSILLNGATDPISIHNDLIFKQVQLYILASKCFI